MAETKTPCNQIGDCIFANDIAEIKSDTKDIKRILNGNGQPGLVAKVYSHDKHISNQQRRQWDITTMIFRTVIGILVTYIAYRVGLKP